MMESKDTLERLLDRYFEGLTSGEEEKEIRLLFRQGEVPEHLEVYRSLFAYLEEKSETAGQQTSTGNKKELPRRRTFRLHAAASIAAGLLLLLGVAGLWNTLRPVSDNYVWIDGKRYTDQMLVQQQARAAFEAVSFSQEDILFTLFEE